MIAFKVLSPSRVPIETEFTLRLHDFNLQRNSHKKKNKGVLRKITEGLGVSSKFSQRLSCQTHIHKHNTPHATVNAYNLC